MKVENVRGAEIQRYALSRIVPDAPFCRAEIVHAVSEEMARGLEDVLRRRVPLMLLCRLSEQVIRDVADLVGNALDWPEERRREEVAGLTAKSRSPVVVDETA